LRTRARSWSTPRWSMSPVRSRPVCRLAKRYVPATQ
jgi:hypothetical protein